MLAKNDVRSIKKMNIKTKNGYISRAFAINTFFSTLIPKIILKNVPFVPTMTK